MTATGAGAGQLRATPGPATGQVLLAVGVVTLAFSLRPAITALGAVLADVRADLAVSGWLAGLLTALPVLCFAAVGAGTHRLTSWAGLHRTALAALVAVAAGSLARVLVDSAAVFTVASAVALAGVAVGNVALPPLVKQHFPDRIAAVTALYSCALLAGAAVPAGATVPLADAAGGWRWGLGLWGLVALLSALPWLALLRHDVREAGPAATVGARQLLRSPLAWWMAVFFGSQSAQAYAQFGWLPSIYEDAGLTSQAAALMLTITTAVGVPAPLLLPLYARRTSDHRPLVVLFAAVTAGGLVGLLLAPTAAAWLWAGMLGLGGCAFPWVLAMLALRARTTDGTAALSGFVQSLGYLLSVVGPFGAALLNDASGSWTPALLLLLALTVPMLVCGLRFARPRLLEDELAPR